MIFISIGATLYAAITITLHALDLRHIQPLTISIYLQIIAVVSFQTVKVENINFNVYKENIPVN